MSSGQVDSARRTVCTSLYSSFAPPACSLFLLRDAHLYCYVIYLSYPRRAKECARPSGRPGISGTEEVARGGHPLLFTLANFTPREAARQVYRATHNFVLSRLTNAPAYPKLRRSAKVWVAERRGGGGERKWERVRREAEYRYSPMGEINWNRGGNRASRR